MEKTKTNNIYKINEESKIKTLETTNHKIKELRLDSIFSYGSWIISDTLAGGLFVCGTLMNSNVAAGAGILSFITSSLGLYAVTKSRKEEDIRGQIKKLKEEKRKLLEETQYTNKNKTLIKRKIN